MARLLDADAVVYGKGFLRSKWWAPVRWLHNGVRLVALLLRRRPRLVLVTNPPIWPALICWAWLRLVRGTLVLDSHPGGFGRQGDAVGKRVQGWHRRLVARAACVLVTTPELAEVVQSWGGTPLVFHEAPLTWEVPPARRSDQPLSVLYIGNFNADEPLDVVMEAARDATCWRVRVTGDPSKAPEGMTIGPVSPSIEFLGWLPQDQYVEEMADSDVVCVLTTEPTSVMRAAVEAVHAVRPLVVSDTDATRAAFPLAVHVSNDAAALRRAIEEISADRDTALARAQEARRIADRKVEEQAKVLRALVLPPREAG